LQKEQNTNQPMRLRSFAILEPCGLGMFRGVEFVCCPKELEERIEKVVDLETAEKKTEDEDEDEDDDDEEYSEEDEEEEKTKKDKKDEVEQQDPYFKEDATENEHERFREAEERLEKKHRKKVTKVITEWSELFERYNKMKEKDPKGAEQYKREM
jgi:amyloid beta A4 protein